MRLSFRTGVDTTTDPCSVCLESDDSRSPKMWLREKSAEGAALITIHVHCLMSKMAKAIKKDSTL